MILGQLKKISPRKKMRSKFLRSVHLNRSIAVITEGSRQSIFGGTVNYLSHIQLKILISMRTDTAIKSISMINRANSRANNSSRD